MYPGLGDMERGEIPGLPAVRRRHLPSGRFVLPISGMIKFLIWPVEHDGDVFPACICLSGWSTSSWGWAGTWRRTVRWSGSTGAGCTLHRDVNYGAVLSLAYQDGISLTAAQRIQLPAPVTYSSRCEILASHPHRPSGPINSFLSSVYLWNELATVPSRTQTKSYTQCVLIRDPGGAIVGVPFTTLWPGLTSR